MEELFTALKPIIFDLIIVLVTALASWIGLVVKGWITDKRSAVQAGQIKAIIEDTVVYVEQIAKNLNIDSAGKFELAKDKAIAYLKSKGFEVSEVELTVLIEAAVNAFFPHWEEIGSKELDGSVDKLEEELADIAKSAGTD